MEMMKMRTKTTWLSRMNGEEGEWEMRPGGMVVQKRTGSELDYGATVKPLIQVRVKFGSIYHQVNISSQATFGELKKMLSGPTGLHYEDQKLLFKDKERDSKTFLDIVGVKNKSKIVLIEDPISQEKRHIEMRKKAKQEKALKSISEISLEVDRLAGKVSMLESIMSKGGKVVEKDLLSLTEHLMNQLLNLNGIIGDGDVKLQREMQVKRVQKYVESLDMLKLKNSTSTSNGTKIPKQHTPIQQQQTPPPKYSNGHISSINQHQQPHNFIGSLQNQTRAKQDHSSNHSPSASVVITTQWETFDVGPSIVYAAPKFNWDLL